MAETMVCLARNIRAVALAADSAIRRSGRKPIILEACGSSLQKIFATAIVGSKQHSDPCFSLLLIFHNAYPILLLFSSNTVKLFGSQAVFFFLLYQKFILSLLMQLRVLLPAVVKSSLSVFFSTLSSFTGPEARHPSHARRDWILGHQSL